MLRMLVFLMAFAAALPVFAGSEKESYSARPGLFFAWLSPDDGAVFARFDQSAHLQQLVQHCRAGRPVFALQGGARYQCRLEVPASGAAGQGPDVVGVTVQGPVPESDRREYRLFALAPPATPRWEVRPTAPDERRALLAWLQSDARRFGGFVKQLAWSGATSVTQPQGERATVVVPGKTVRDAAAFYEAQRHHVFVRTRTAYAYMGEVPGTPAGYVDIDGSDAPGLVVAEGCDGWCISLWGLKGGLRQVGAFGGH